MFGRAIWVIIFSRVRLPLSLPSRRLLMYQTALPNYLVKLLPNLESLNLSHNRFLALPPYITSLRSLSRLKTHGNGLINSRKSKDGVGIRSTSKIVGKIIEERVAAFDGVERLREVVRKEREGVESLSIICAKVLRRRIRSDPTLITTLDDLPPHLLSLILDSYTCSSCFSITPTTSPSHLPTKLYESICHLPTSIVLPDFRSRQAAAASRMDVLDRSTRRRNEDPRLEFKPPMVILTTRQISMLAISHIEKWSDDSISGYITGPPSSFSAYEEEGNDYRFCFECCAVHLGLEGWEGGECGCCVCQGQREVLGEEEGREGRRVRWFRVL